MQTHSFLARAILASVGLVFVAETHAALNYNEGDLIMAFRATGGTGAADNYLLNLGPKTLFTNATSIITLDAQLGNFELDLETKYTMAWQPRADLFWSIFGVHKSEFAEYAANSMFVTRARAAGTTAGVAGSTAWLAPSAFGAGSPAGKILELGLRYEMGNGGAQPTGSTQSTNSPLGLLQPDGVTQSYRSYMPGGVNTTQSIAFNFFGTAGTIEGITSLGLDLYTLTPGGGAGVYEGSFSLASNGAVTFTPVGVPEPSSIIALGAGLVALTSIRRRHANR